MVLTCYWASLRFIVVGYLCVNNVVCVAFQKTIRCILFGDRGAKPGFFCCLGSLLRKKCAIKIMALSIMSHGIQRLTYFRLTLLKFSPKNRWADAVKLDRSLSWFFAAQRYQASFSAGLNHFKMNI